MRMKVVKIPSGRRKAVNLSLDTGVVEAARDLGLNLSQICEEGLRAAIKIASEAQWREQNQLAIAAHNAWVEEHGLPLERYRMF